MNEDQISWLPFAGLCTVALFGVLLIGELASPERRTVPKADNSAELAAQRLKVAHQNARSDLELAFLTAEDILAHHIETLRTPITADGAELLLPGGHQLLGYLLVPGDAGRELLVVHRRLSGPDTPLLVELYSKEGEGWGNGPLRKPRFRKDMPFPAPLTDEQVTLILTGNVVVIGLPATQTCSGAVALRTRHHLMLGTRPRLVLEHIARGRATRQPFLQADLRMQWNEGGSGGTATTIVLTWPPRPNAPVVQTFVYPFSFDGQGFNIEDGLQNLWNDKLNEAASLRQRVNLQAAQPRFQEIANGLDLVGPLEGPTPYCLEFPHRHRPDRTINALRWRGQLHERLLQARLPLAFLIAQRGDGPRALASLGLDPGFARSSLATSRDGKDFILLLKRPTPTTTLSIKNFREFQDVTLTSVPSKAQPSLHPHPQPLQWWDPRTVLIPTVPDLRAQGRQAATMLAGLVDLTHHQPQHLLTYHRLLPPPHGAVWMAFEHQARRALFTQLQAQRMAVVQHLDALDWSRIRANHLGLYTGPPILQLSRDALGLANASSRQMRTYVPLDMPRDRSPNDVNLLLDYHWDCNGITTILCEFSRPELCTDTEALGLVARDWEGNLSAARAQPHLNVRRLGLELCSEASLEGEDPIRIELLGWLDDNHLVFLFNERHLVVHVPDPANAPLSRVERTLDPDNVRWFWPFGGPSRRYRVFIDDYALWAYDRTLERYYIIEWANQLSISNASRPWRAALADDGRSLAFWQEGRGFWTAVVDGLP